MFGVACNGDCGMKFGNVGGEGIVVAKTSAPIYACSRCFSGGIELQTCNVALCKQCMKKLISKQPKGRPSRNQKY
jgi:hypothetical protein